MDIQTALDEFCIEQEALGNRPRTIGTYRQRIMKMVRWLESGGHGRSLDSCTRSTINLYVAWLRTNKTRHADNPHRPTVSGELSRNTVNSHIRDMKVFFKWCVDLEYLGKNPVSHLRRIKTEHGKKGRMMSYQDFRQLLPMVIDMSLSDEPCDVRDAAMWLLVADTACRSGELISLTTKTCCEVAGKNTFKCWVEQSKVEKGWIYYGEVTSRAVKRWLEMRPGCNHDLLWVGLGNKYLGRPMTTSGVYQSFRRIAQIENVTRNYSPHALRHLNGWWYTDRYGVVVAQHKLRHKSHMVTGHFYANVDDSDVIEKTRLGSLVQVS